MADLSTLQQQDNYSTRLASKYTAGDASMIVNTAPSFTYSVDFYVTVEPGTTNARSYKISGITASTFTVSGSAPVASYEGETPTSIDHPAGSTVIISNNYKFFDDIRDAVNAKVDTSGDTMTGLLQFSGTTHAGIRLINLTTAQRTALSAANGDLVYDTDDNLVYQYKGGAWASVDTGTTTPNASTTVGGIIELATVAEQGTATGTGGSGASLVPANANLVKTSSGAGDENKIAVLDANGQFAQGFIPSAFQVFTGMTIPHPMNTIPTGWLLCDGSAVSRTTYADLWAYLNPNLGNPTITIASPAVVTLASHGLESGDSIYFTTTGALPTGISANTIYYVIATGLTTDTFQFSTSRGGSAVNTSGSQSGTHSLYASPWGLGNGSTTFNVPGFKTRTLAGKDNSDSDFIALGKTGGAKTHTLTIAEMPAHTHDIQVFSKLFTTGGVGADEISQFGSTTEAAAALSTGGGGSHNNLQPYAVVNFIIKT